MDTVVDQLLCGILPERFVERAEDFAGLNQGDSHVVGDLRAETGEILPNKVTELARKLYPSGPSTDAVYAVCGLKESTGELTITAKNA